MRTEDRVGLSELWCVNAGKKPGIPVKNLKKIWKVPDGQSVTNAERRNIEGEAREYLEHVQALPGITWTHLEWHKCQ